METVEVLQQYHSFKQEQLSLEKEYLAKAEVLKNRYNWFLSIIHSLIYIYVMTLEGMEEHENLQLEFNFYDKVSGLEVLDITIINQDGIVVLKDLIELETLVNIMENLSYAEVMEHVPDTSKVKIKDNNDDF